MRSSGLASAASPERNRRAATSLWAGLREKVRVTTMRHPVLTSSVLVGIAGLVAGRRTKGELSGTLVKLGGLALISSVAFQAYRILSRSAEGEGKDPSNLHAPEGRIFRARREATEEKVKHMPETSPFHPVSQTEDDALLFLRAMVAAASADGRVDEGERGRIIKGLTEAGIDPQASHWLETEMASPADPEELAAGVDDPEKAAQVYAAARIAIDPDTIQEREFLSQLAAALDLPKEVKRQIDETADALR